MTVAVAGSPEWLRLARLARALSWLTLGWLGIEAGVAIGAAVTARSVALLGFGLDSGIEAMASLIVIWQFTGPRLASATSEQHAQQLVAVSFFLLAPYIAAEAIRALAAGDRPETSITGLVLTAGTAIFEPALGVIKRRIGTRLGSPATAGEGTQNLLCAYLAIAVFAGLAANTLLGAWWLDGLVALGIAGWAVVEGRRARAGKSCGCGCQPGADHCSAPTQSQTLPAQVRGMTPGTPAAYQLPVIQPLTRLWRSVRSHGDTKTEKSRRTLALPEMALTALRAHRERQADERAAVGMTWSGRDLVFSTRTGAALDAAKVRREFRTVCKAAKIGEHWTP
jgi:hypothetical protein